MSDSEPPKLKSLRSALIEIADMGDVAYDTDAELMECALRVVRNLRTTKLVVATTVVRTLLQECVDDEMRLAVIQGSGVCFKCGGFIGDFDCCYCSRDD